MEYSCPKGHVSTEADFCSECGFKLQADPAGTAPASLAATTESCPDCRAPRSDHSTNFCEVCGYNFSTGTHGNLAPAVQPTPPPTPPPAPAAPISWELTATVDPSLAEPGGPEPPTNIAPLVLAIDKPSNLIGRTSGKRAIHPEIAVDFDDAISHRHALLSIGVDGSLVLRDLESANGTKLNAVELKPLTDAPLKDGDQITLGRWTRIAVKSRS